jgi:hypothetical protein
MRAVYYSTGSGEAAEHRKYIVGRYKATCLSVDDKKALSKEAFEVRGNL